MLVLMALVTTFMAGPLLQAARPEERATARRSRRSSRRRASARSPSSPALPVPERVDPASRRRPRRRCRSCCALAEPLARSEPPRELILARLVRAAARRRPRAAGSRPRTGCCSEATARDRRGRGASWSTRGSPRAAWRSSSADPGADLARLAAERGGRPACSIDGRRPLLGEGVPRGDVGRVLQRGAVRRRRCWSPARASRSCCRRRARRCSSRSAAPSTTGRRSSSAPGSRRATEAPLKLLGAAGPDRGARARSRRLLGDAGLLVQQYGGIATEPVVAEGGREGIVEAAAGAGPAGHRPLRALARGGPRPDALGDRQGRAGAGALRAPRARDRARSRRGATSPASPGPRRAPAISPSGRGRAIGSPRRWARSPSSSPARARRRSAWAPTCSRPGRTSSTATSTRPTEASGLPIRTAVPRGPDRGAHAHRRRPAGAVRDLARGGRGRARVRARPRLRRRPQPRRVHGRGGRRARSALEDGMRLVVRARPADGRHPVRAPGRAWRRSSGSTAEQVEELCDQASDAGRSRPRTSTRRRRSSSPARRPAVERLIELAERGRGREGARASRWAPPSTAS